MSEIAVYDGRSAIDYIVGGSMHVPTTYRVAGDTLGLAEHDHVRAAIATETYNRFNAVCSDIIVANPDVRERFLSGSDTITIGTLRVGNLHEFEVIRHAHSQGAQYTVARKDTGTESGGFTINKLPQGAVILTQYGEPRALDEYSDEYVDVLGQVVRFLDVFAASHNLAVPTTGNILSEKEFYTRAKNAQNEQNSLKNKTLRAVRPAARFAVNSVTAKTELGNRKASPKKIAAIALLMVLPGYSSRVVEDVPIPRPASVEIASDTMHAMFDDEPLTAEQVATNEFRASNANLPESAYISELGTAHAITVVPDVGSDIATHADSKNVLIGQDSMVVTSLAPTRVTIDGKLSSGECAVLGIDTAVQTGTYAVVGLTEASVKDLNVTASRENISICNTSDKSIFTDDTVLYIDAK